MKLPYGKYKGKEVKEVLNEENGRGYLGWLHEQLDPNDDKYGQKNTELRNEIGGVLGFFTEQETVVPKTETTVLERLENKLDTIIGILGQDKKWEE